MKLIFAGLFLLVLTSFLEAVVIQVENLPERCDFRKCTPPDPSKLNVHLVPHTHDDVGWLKTVDEYFFGLNVSLQNAGVQYILDSVIAELIKNKQRRFIYVETAFFWKWWRLQDDHQRAIVKELVKTGQLEFIGGGWSMNDEATSHYSAIVDQMTWGHRRLKDTFGRCGVPKVAWQIDPFGHSKEQANLFAAMNFDALFFAREDYQDKAKRAASKTLEHVWQASSDLGKAGDLFTGMMYMGYGPPSKFNWDLIAMSNVDTPVIDDLDSEEYNVPAIVEKFTASAKAYAAHYATNSILYPMGTDFQYQAAGTWFTNLDRLIKALESSGELKVFYSTPSCYAKALHDTKRKWTSKTDDYFPYANAEHSYWTGYFTSRPAVKYMERYGNNVLQACKQVASLASASGKTDYLKTERRLTKMREWMGVLQHHDAVTGTEKQHVAYDYAKNLNSALMGCVDILLESYSSSLLPKSSPAISASEAPVLQQVYCPQLNESACAATESGRPFIVSIFNPIGHKRVGHLIKLPVGNVDSAFYSVTGPKGESVAASLVAIPEYVQQLPGRKSQASFELVFRVDLPPLGLATYFVAVSKTRSANSAPKAVESRISRQTVLSGQTVKVVFAEDGALDRLELPNGQSLKLAVDFRYFRGHTGNNIPDSHRASGAYVFRPTDDQKTIKVGQITRAELFASNSKSGGDLGVAEVHLQYDSFVNLVVRVDSTADILELDWVVGPIEVKDGIGKEVILTVSLPDLANNRTFWTDANGRQMMERKWNFRPTWRLNVSEPVSGNYYPVVSRIALVDEKKGIQATLMNDRSQGGTSRVDGELELMVHRRLLHDDDFGVGEALNETGVNGKGLVVRGRHILLVGPKATAARDHRLLGVELFLQPVTTFIVNDDLPEATFRKYYNTEVAGLTTELPPNVHLMTVEGWKGEDRLLVRLEHIFQKGEDAELSKPATVDLRNLFARFEVVEAKELTLSANADVEALKDRLIFDYTPIGSVSTPVTEPVGGGEELTVKLHPMQIRTFEVKVRRL